VLTRLVSGLFGLFSANLDALVRDRGDQLLEMRESLLLGKRSHRKSEEGLSLLGSQRAIKTDAPRPREPRRASPSRVQDELACADDVLPHHAGVHQPLFEQPASRARVAPRSHERVQRQSLPGDQSLPRDTIFVWRFSIRLD